MRFFLPAAKSDIEAEEVYSLIKSHLSVELGAQFSDRRVAVLSYVHNGKNYLAEVGKPENGDGEVVVAILYEPGRTLYHVCTANRGVVRGMTILVGEHDVRSVSDFEE